MTTACVLPRRLFTRSRSVSNVMYPSPSIASAFNRRVAEVGHYFLGVALVELAHSLDAEQRRAAEEGLSDDEYALFQMLFNDNISQADRDKLKQASKSLLASLHELLTPMYDWTKNTSTQAEVKVFILESIRKHDLAKE